MNPVAIIRKRKGKFYLVSHKGKTLGVHTTREEALKQERAIEINKHADITLEAAKLTAGIARVLLAATEHDERGRFTGPGGGGSGGAEKGGAHSLAAGSKSIEAEHVSEHADGWHGTVADHHKAANAHIDAAAAHRIAAHEAEKSGNLSMAESHDDSAKYHDRRVREHRMAAAQMPQRTPEYDKQTVQPRLREGAAGKPVERRADYKPLRDQTKKKK